MKQTTEQKIQLAIDSLQNVERAAAPPFLFSRVEAKMQRNNSGVWNNLFGYFTRPVVACASLCILFVINLVIVAQTQPDQPAPIVELNTVEEYQTVSTSYDFENWIP